MDQHRFTALKDSLGSLPTRRDVLRGLASAGLGLGTLRLSDAVEAKSKKKGKKKKKGKSKKQQQPVLNQYGCLDVGQPCKGDSTLCCSGICEGTAPKKGKQDASRCVAHDTGTCRQEGEGICTATNPAALKCNNSVNCGCIKTTAGSNFCYEGENGGNYCADCRKDADCVALGYPPGSACAPTAIGLCAGLCATGMACLAPCGTAPTQPVEK